MSAPEKHTDFSNSDEILRRLLQLHPKRIDLSLGRLERLLDRLGNPERALPPIIHVAGTNGKGSVVAYLRAGLEAAGLRAHAYTSPHLVRFHERIRLAGALIEESLLSALLEECEQANGEEPITFFEITTAAGFLAFSRAPADILLLEVGLGGRLDATNVVDKPLVSVITPVSADHQEFLGGDVATIAGEKAGILKSNVPAVIGPQSGEAAAAITEIASGLDVQLFRAGAEWSVERDGDALVFRGAKRERQLPLPALPGPHQRQNAGMALAVLDLLDQFSLPDVAYGRAMTDVEWPARMHRLSEGPLTEMLPAGSELWLDGGHNPAAGKFLAGALRDLETMPTVLICGMLKNKDVEGFLAHLCGLAECAMTIPIEGEDASRDAEDTAAEARRAGLRAVPCDSLEHALERVSDRGSSRARVVICGSLYLAGQVLRENRGSK